MKSTPIELLIEVLAHYDEFRAANKGLSIPVDKTMEKIRAYLGLIA